MEIKYTTKYGNALTDGTEPRQWNTLDNNESTELYPNSNV